MDKNPFLLPTTDRLLRGVQSALVELEVDDRPDLIHTFQKIDAVLGHLRKRLSAEDLKEFFGEVAGLLEQASSELDYDKRITVDSVSELTEFSSYSDFELVQETLMRGFSQLRDCVSHSGEAGVSEQSLIRSIESLETRFYAWGADFPARPPTSSMPRITKSGFEAYIRARHSGRFKEVSAFNRLVGGFQKETILAELVDHEGARIPVVIRAEKEDRFVRFTASDICDEFAVVVKMRELGVPVATPLWLEDDASQLGRRFFVSAKAAGENVGGALEVNPTYSKALTYSFMDTLASIHTLPVARASENNVLSTWNDGASLHENTLREVRAWRNQIWLGDPAPASPVFARLFDWLEVNAPEEDGEKCVLHNDYGPHNILVEGGGVTAVLDWEIARLGDPAEDLAFFFMNAGHAIDRDQAIARYEDMSARRISLYRLAYFDAFTIGKVLVSTLSANAMFENTDPALIDWTQMPILWHSAFASQVEDKIAAAEKCRLG